MSGAVVQFGQPGATTEQFQSSQVTQRPFDDVVATVRGEIERAGLRVLNEIDPQKALEGIDRTIGGSRLIFFFHPNLVVRVLQADWTAMVEAPLKLLVIELPDGTVSVRMADPAASFARYGNPALADLGQELAATCRTIMEATR